MLGSLRKIGADVQNYLINGNKNVIFCENRRGKRFTITIILMIKTKFEQAVPI